MSYIPRRPIGFNQEAMFFQAVWDKLFGPEGKIIGSPNVKVSKTTRGTFIEVVQNPSGGTVTESSRDLSLKITEVNDDYLVCRTYYVDAENVGHTGTVDILVAKRLPMRVAWKDGDTTETILGVEYTHSVVGGEDDDTNNYRRTHDDATPTPNTQLEECHRPFEVGNQITAEKVDHTGVFVEGVELTLLDCSERFWARKAVQ